MHRHAYITLLLALAYMVPALAQNHLQLPAIPDSLQTPQQRADYLAAHYWDNMDFEAAAQDTLMVEQAFADYATILPIATQGASLQTAIDGIMERAGTANLMGYVAEKYLYEPESPTYNEDTYLYFLDAQLKDSQLSATTRQKLEMQRELAVLNSTGSTANDFRFTTRAGEEKSLAESLQGKPTILIFRDLECEKCHMLLSEMSGDAWIWRNTTFGYLNVLLVSPYDQREEWEADETRYSEHWVDACDVTGVADEDLYDIRTTPTIYLIDGNGKVLLKCRPMSEVMERLSKILM